jgi:hypothetical protein
MAYLYFRRIRRRVNNSDLLRMSRTAQARLITQAIASELVSYIAAPALRRAVACRPVAEMANFHISHAVSFDCLS